LFAMAMWAGRPSRRWYRRLLAAARRSR
jgi:hypothetical protein